MSIWRAPQRRGGSRRTSSRCLVASLIVLIGAAAAASAPSPPPTSWPDAPAARAWWPELGGLPLSAPPPLVLAAPRLALVSSPDFTSASLAVVVALDLGPTGVGGGDAAASSAISAAWATPAKVPGYSSADSWPTVASPRPLLLAAGGDVVVTGATLRSTPQSPPNRAAVGLAGVRTAGGAQAWSWALPAEHAALLISYAVAPAVGAPRVQVLFTASDGAGANSLLFAAVDAASGAAAQAAPWNLTALGALSGCNASAVTSASGFTLSADGASALVTASYAPYSSCLVMLDVASGSALWSAPAAQAPAWDPVGDPADPLQAFVWLSQAPLTLTAVGLRDGGVQRWSAALPANESAVVGLAVAAGFVFVGATYAPSGCPVGLLRVYAFNATTGASIGAPFSFARYPDVGAEGALTAVAVGGAAAGAAAVAGASVGAAAHGAAASAAAADAAGASAAAVVYVRTTGTRDAAEGLDSYLAALAFDGRGFVLAHESTGAGTGVGVAGASPQCRRGDAGYAPAGSLLVAGPQLLLADAGGVVLLGGGAP
jgi:hypothetical protein